MATPAPPLLQVPPASASVKNVFKPTPIATTPPIAGGTGFTVKVAVAAAQPGVV